MKIRKENRPFVFAHRGASGYLPENTIESFARAIEMNADGIELDVQLSKDGQIIVCHDESIDRVSDHKGFVKDFTLEELKSFNFNNKMEGSYQIATLQEVLDLIKPTELLLNIEIKSNIFQYPNLEEMTLDMVRRNGMEKQVLYSSFNHYSLQKIREMDKDAYIGFLHEDGIIKMAEYARSYGADALHPALYHLLNPLYIKNAREQGLEINTYTVNEELYMMMAKKLQIDGIFTNYPDKALQLYK